MLLCCSCCVAAAGWHGCFAAGCASSAAYHLDGAPPAEPADAAGDAAAFVDRSLPARSVLQTMIAPPARSDGSSFSLRKILDHRAAHSGESARNGWAPAAEMTF